MKVFFLFIPLFLFAAPYFVHATSGPVGHWKFDETVAGGNAADASGNGNDAVPSGTPTPSTDTPAAIKFNNPRSISLDGSSYLTIDRTIEDSFSICVWVKTLSVGVGTAHWQTAALFDSELGGLGDDMGFGIDDNGYLAYGNGGAFDDVVHGDTLVADNTWHHACVTRDQSSGTVVLYVDGVSDATGVIDTATLDGNPEAMIGNGTDGATVLAGLLDDYRIYDRVLTRDEIAYLAAGNDGTVAPESESERAVINSWKVSFDEGNKKCPEKIKVVIKGKYFDDDAEVFIGNKKASSVTISSEKRLTANFCLSKLLAIQTDLRRSISVENPNTDARKAAKKINLALLPTSRNFDQATKEGIINIQKVLVLHNLLEKEHITGFYGPLTQAAVKQFQKDQGIAPTGKVGPQTIAAFE